MHTSRLSAWENQISKIFSTRLMGVFWRILIIEVILLIGTLLYEAVFRHAGISHLFWYALRILGLVGIIILFMMVTLQRFLTKKIIDDCGISIIETPEIDVKKAVQMAVDRVKPFEEKHEKGFRDYVNLCTVLEYARVKRDGFHLLIAGDEVYRDENVQKLAVQYGVELIVRCSIEHAISVLEGCVGSKEKEIRDKELQPLKSYLMTMTDEVSIYIFENVVIDELFLSKNDELGLFPQIEAVDDIRVTEVTDEVRGVLPEDTREGRVKITFLAKTKVLVRMRDIAFPSETVFIQGRKVSSGQAAYLASLLGGGTGKATSREIERLFSVAGSVSFKRRGSENGDCIISYSDLDLDHVSVPL